MIKTYLGGTEGLTYDAANAVNTLDALKKVCVTGTPTLPVDNGLIVNGSELSINFNTQHSFKVGQTIELQGANSPVHNGLYRIWRVEGSNIIVDARDANTPTGAITVRTPPLGWTLEYEDANANIIVIKPASTVSKNLYYQIEEIPGGVSGYNNSIRLRVFESMSGIGNGVELYSTKSLFSGRDFIILGDGMSLYLFSRDPVLITRMRGIVFGACTSFLTGDLYPSLFSSVGLVANSFSKILLHRDVDSLTKTVEHDVTVDRIGLRNSIKSFSELNPGQLDVYLEPVYIAKTDPPKVLRGRMPGMYGTPDHRGVALGDNGREKFFKISGKDYLYLKLDGTSDPTDSGTGIVIDLDAWR